jgi:phosphopantetheinyl transferase
VTEPSIGGGAAEALAVRRPGYWLLRAPWSAPERDRVAAAYLDDAERSTVGRLHAGALDDRVRGRVAAKDAVRAWFVGRGVDGVRPWDVTVVNDPAGRPLVRVTGLTRVVGIPSLSVAHRRPVAVAVAVGPGEAAGIDVEVVEPRGSVFARLALNASELRLGDAVGIHPDTWVTRVWTVKEAVAKAAGTGLQGRPKDFVVHEVEGAWARAAGPGPTRGLWVRSSDEGDMVVSVVARRDAVPDDACPDA